MAKIGNEAKLILKLANARMKALEELVIQANFIEPYKQGYNKASRDWWENLLTISNELER